MPLPPWSEVWDAIRLLIVPGLGASFLVLLIIRSIVGLRFSAVAVVFGLAAGLLAGNYFREAIPWRFDSDRPLNQRDLRMVLAWSLEGKPPADSLEGDEGHEEQPSIPASLYWLPWAAALAMLVDLLARLIPFPTIGWSLRTIIAVFAGRLLTAADVRLDAPWVSWALGGAILSGWALLGALATMWQDGTLAAAIAACFAVAAMILLHAHSAKLTDFALLASMALVGTALAAWVRPSDTGSALAAAAVFLPGLLLNGQHSTFSEVPKLSFVLAALAPLAVTPMLIPMLARQSRWKRWLPAIGLPLIPAIWALVLAARAETLQF